MSIDTLNVITLDTFAYINRITYICENIKYMGFKTYEEIQQAWDTDNTSEKTIKKAVELQDSVKFLSNFIKFLPNDDLLSNKLPKSVLRGLTSFISKISNILSPNNTDSSGKFVAFKELFVNPAREIFQEVYDEFNRIFDAQDSIDKVIINKAFGADSGKTIKANMEAYRQTHLKDYQYFKRVGVETIIEEPNAVLVVDIRKELLDGKPETYYYKLPAIAIKRFKETSLIHNNSAISGFEYLMFEGLFTTDNGNIIDAIFVYDNEFYRTFEKSNATQQFSEKTLLHESKHIFKTNGKPVCPAKFFGNRSLFSEEPAIKQSIVHAVLDSFFILVLDSVAKIYSGLFAKYPIVLHVQEEENSDDYEGTVEPHYDENGLSKSHLSEHEEQYIKNKNSATFKISFPGTAIGIPAMTKDGELVAPDVSKFLDFKSPDVSILKFQNEDIELQKKTINRHLIGVSDFNTENQAVNSDQVGSWFEAKTNKMRRFSTDLQATHHFGVDLCLQGRFTNQYSTFILDYGTNFYLQSETTIINNYSTAQLAGLPVSFLYRNLQDINNSRYKLNPEYREFADFLLKIEPFPLKTSEQVKSVFPEIDIAQLYLKDNFDAVISEYERNKKAPLIQLMQKIDSLTQLKKELLEITKKMFNLI